MLRIKDIIYSMTTFFGVAVVVVVVGGGGMNINVVVFV